MWSSSYFNILSDFVEIDKKITIKDSEKRLMESLKKYEVIKEVGVTIFYIFTLFINFSFH